MVGTHAPLTFARISTERLERLHRRYRELAAARLVPAWYASAVLAEVDAELAVRKAVAA